jgi:hypothetical protein
VKLQGAVLLVRERRLHQFREEGRLDQFHCRIYVIGVCLSMAYTAL